jgi:DNA repair/transcription protein MET18/MMS19
LILAAKTVYASPDTIRRQSDEKSLSPFRGNLVDVMREGLRTEDLKSSAIKGSVSIIELPDFVSRTEIEDIVRSMDDILINDTDAENRYVCEIFHCSPLTSVPPL